MEKRLFTSESVTEGHPDKICDNISDGILDALMEQDPMSRVACETAITTDYVLIMGEITTKAKVDYEKIARETIREIGYDADEKGFNCDTCRVKVLLDSQSPDIAMGVDKALEARENEMSDEQLEAIGAGDQHGHQPHPDDAGPVRPGHPPQAGHEGQLRHHLLLHLQRLLP